MHNELRKFKNLPIWGKIVVIIFILLVIYSIGEVDLFLW